MLFVSKKTINNNYYEMIYKYLYNLREKCVLLLFWIKWNHLFIIAFFNIFTICSLIYHNFFDVTQI